MLQMVPQNGDWWFYSCTKADFLMFLLTPTSKAGNSRQIKREKGVLRSENSSSRRSGFNYHKQPFLLLLLSWKKARQRAAAQVKGSIAESREGSRQWRGDSLQRHTHAQHCRLPHGLGGPLKEAAAPSPLSEMLDTFPLSQPWWETDLEENASKALGCPRKGGLCAPHKPATSACTTQRKSLLAYNAHPQKTFSFICN